MLTLLVYVRTFVLFYYSRLKFCFFGGERPLLVRKEKKGKKNDSFGVFSLSLSLLFSLTHAASSAPPVHLFLKWTRSREKGRERKNGVKRKKGLSFFLFCRCGLAAALQPSPLSLFPFVLVLSPTTLSSPISPITQSAWMTPGNQHSSVSSRLSSTTEHGAPRSATPTGGSRKTQRMETQVSAAEA